MLTILAHRTKDVQVVTRFGEPDAIDCYAGLLNQAILNLLANAIDAINERGTVAITTGAEGGMYSIEIADDGHGIAPGIHSRIFEPFFTTKPIGQGTGLGLPISYSIVKKHGGELEINPAPGGGTVAVIRIPLP